MWNIGGIIGQMTAGFNAVIAILAYLVVYTQIYRKQKQTALAEREIRLKNLHRNTFRNYSE